MKIKIDQKFIAKDKLYGTTKVGARGQVVIPALARKELGLKVGESLLVIGKHGKALGLVRAEDMEEMLIMLMSKITQKTWKEKFRKHVEEMFGKKLSLKIQTDKFK